MLKYYYVIGFVLHSHRHHPSHRLYQHSEAVVTLNATDCTTEQCNFLYVSLTVFYFDNEQAVMLQNMLCLCAREAPACAIWQYQRWLVIQIQLLQNK